MKNTDALKNGLIRNETKWPEIFGLSEVEVIEIMNAVGEYSLVKDSQSYSDWAKMYNGVHSESTFEKGIRNWLACLRWIKSKSQPTDDLIKAIEKYDEQILRIKKGGDDLPSYNKGRLKSYEEMKEYLLSLQSQQGVAMSGNIDAKDYIIGEDLKTNLERQSVGRLKEDDFSNLKESEIFKPAKSNDADEKDFVESLYNDKELELSEKAHDITIEQLRRTQQERNKWEELCERLLKEMDAVEWQSPMQEEARKLLNEDIPLEHTYIKSKPVELLYSVVDEKDWIFINKEIPDKDGFYETRDSGYVENTLWFDKHSGTWFYDLGKQVYPYLIAYWRTHGAKFQSSPNIKVEEEKFNDVVNTQEKGEMFMAQLNHLSSPKINVEEEKESWRIKELARLADAYTKLELENRELRGKLHKYDTY